MGSTRRHLQAFAEDVQVFWLRNAVNLGDVFAVLAIGASAWTLFALAGLVSFAASGPLCPPTPAGVSADQCPTCRAGCPYCPLGSGRDE